MFAGLLKKFLPPSENKFYTYFEEGAATCTLAAQLFNDIVFNGLTEARLVEARTIKGKSVFTAKNTLNELNKTFITPIDREDILYLSNLMNKIAKRIIRTCVNIKVYRLNVYPEIMKHQAETLLLATKELQSVVALLQKDASLKEISESNHRMMEIENHGDEILFNAMDNIFSGKNDALDVLKLRDIFKTIEGALDYCYSASDTILNISLKHD